MPILYLDFETFFDQEYSLSKMAPPNYILDAKFETIGCAVRFEGDAASRWIDGPDFPAFLATLDPAKTATVAFNALFDNCVLAWRYNFVPQKMYCTMRMAVALCGHELERHSLAKVAEHLKVGIKGEETLLLAKGKRRGEMRENPDFWRRFKAYACNDNDMNQRIFHALLPSFPKSEHRVMDRVLRCGVVPRFRVNADLLVEYLRELEERRIDMLINAGAPTDRDDDDCAEKLEAFARDLRSNPKFENLLKLLGVAVEYKVSGTDPSRLIPQFAKTDPFMADLLEHEDPEIQALAAARLGIRSTIEQTRGKRMLSIAQLKWPRYLRGNMPVPLKYAAAHTHRLGGDWAINMQNLPAGRGGKSSKLRQSMEAPPGYKVVVADKSQIECRINAHICGQTSLLNQFRNRQDPYAVLASYIFRHPVNKTEHPVKRFIGKTGVLGLGYGCGPDRFYAMVISSARSLGLDMAELMEIWNERTAGEAVHTYRRLNSSIVSMWARLDDVLTGVWCGHGTMPLQLGPVMIGSGYVEGPGGLRMNYGDPRMGVEGPKFTYAGREYDLYGAKFLENIVQFLARINTMHDALRISDRGFPFALQSHDELAWVVPEGRAQECLAAALEEMRRPPSWAKQLPLDAEGSIGDSYGAAKG